jgi:hypothetical protein
MRQPSSFSRSSPGSGSRTPLSAPRLQTGMGLKLVKHFTDVIDDEHFV